MKKRNWLLLIVTLIAVMALPITANAAKAKISQSKILLTPFTFFKLKIYGTSSKPKWTTSNKSVATVNKNGLVLTQKPGKATITGQIGKKKFKCKITSADFKEAAAKKASKKEVFCANNKVIVKYTNNYKFPAYISIIVYSSFSMTAFVPSSRL